MRTLQLPGYRAAAILCLIALTFWAGYYAGSHAELVRSQHIEQLYFQALKREKALRERPPVLEGQLQIINPKGQQLQIINGVPVLLPLNPPPLAPGARQVDPRRP